MSVLDPGVAAEATEGVVEPGEGIEASLVAARPLRSDVWRRFRQNRMAMLGLGFLLVLIVLAVLAPVIAPYDFDERSPGAFREGPSGDHWFGTDRIGFDVFSRVIYGARISLRVGFLATGMAITIGVLLGAIAGFAGGKIDTLIMRFTDIFLAIPYIILAVAVATIFGQSVTYTVAK